MGEVCEPPTLPLLNWKQSHPIVEDILTTYCSTKIILIDFNADQLSDAPDATVTNFTFNLRPIDSTITRPDSSDLLTPRTSGKRYLRHLGVVPKSQNTMAGFSDDNINTHFTSVTFDTHYSIGSRFPQRAYRWRIFSFSEITRSIGKFVKSLPIVYIQLYLFWDCLSQFQITFWWFLFFLLPYLRTGNLFDQSIWTFCRSYHRTDEWIDILILMRSKKFTCSTF